MSGTKAGGLKAAATNIEKYGDDFYKRIGQKGGRNGHTGGFASNPALAKIAGRKGGSKSRRGPAEKNAKVFHTYGANIIRDYKNGLSLVYIADHYGVSKYMINKFLAEHGVVKEPSVIKEVSETPEHATTKNISVWQKIFRHGKTTIREDEDA